MGLPVDATLGEKIRFCRQQAGLTQKELADLCEVSESAIRNYELGNRVPDFLTLKSITEQLRVSFYAIADVNLTDLNGAVQALFKLEEIYGLYPVEVDGHIHFVFRDSVASSDFQKDPNSALESVSAMLQYRALRFMEVCTRHDAGNLTDEEYALWKSKFPEYQDDFHKAIQTGEDEIALESDPIPMSEPQTPGRSRKRKINSGR